MLSLKLEVIDIMMARAEEKGFQCPRGRVRASIRNLVNKYSYEELLKLKSR